MAEAKPEEKNVVSYHARDGQEIKLSLDIVRKYLVSGRPEYVTDQEIMLYLGTCKARGINPFAKECYLVKYTETDPAATIISIDYYRARARAQEDCRGWQSGIIVKTAQNLAIDRPGAVMFEGDTLLGGWFKAKPATWDIEHYWSVPLNAFIKLTREGKPTRFWSEANQPSQIAKVAESQGLRRVWPDEFGGLMVDAEMQPLDITPSTEGLSKLQHVYVDHKVAQAEEKKAKENPAAPTLTSEEKAAVTEKAIDEVKAPRPASARQELQNWLVKNCADSTEAKAKLKQLSGFSFIANVSEQKALEIMTSFGAREDKQEG